MTPEKFAIVTTQRSGSTLFRLWLNSHPDIRAHGEVFLRQYGAHDGFNHFCSLTPGRRIIHGTLGSRHLCRAVRSFVPAVVIRSYLDSLWSNPEHSGPWTDMTTWNEYQPRGAPESLAGFKIMYSELKCYPYLRGHFARRGVREIHLLRANLLKMYLTRINAKRTGVAHSQEAAPRTSRLKINTILLMAFIRRVERLRGAMARALSRGPYLEVTYEDFVGRTEQVQSSVLQFLGADALEMSWPGLKKMSRGTLEDRIQNYGEVVCALRGTRHQVFLDEG